MAQSFSSSSATSKRRRVTFGRKIGGEIQYEGSKRYCFCGLLAPRWTSWTEKNPGRRFYGCQKYNQGRGCGYFIWHDDEMGQRSFEVIRELMDQIDGLYDENVRLKRRFEGESLGADICSIYQELKKMERRHAKFVIAAESAKKKMKILLLALCLCWVCSLLVLY